MHRLPVLGHLLNMRRDPLSFMTDAAQQGEVVPLYLPRLTYLFNSAAAVKHVLVDHHENYRKGPMSRRLKSYLGDGLLTSEGEWWRSQRRLIQPMLQATSVERMIPAIENSVRDMTTRWRAYCEKAEPINIYSELVRCTTSIIGKLVLGIDLLDVTDRLSKAVRTGLEHAQRREMSLLPLPLSIPTRNNQAAVAATATFNNIIHSQIREHRSRNYKGSDILKSLMDTQDENGHRMTEKQIADQALTLLVAGHTTTATALSWLLYLLARNPQTQDKAADEVIHLLPEGSLHAKQLELLKHVTACFYETLRLYPPSWLLHREALSDDVIGGHKIRAGNAVLICPFLLHRHPSIWSEPDKFDPGRFEAGRLGKDARVAFIPFGAGPRFCVGNHLAVLEARAIVAAILRRYKISLAEDKIVDPYAAITLQPRGGINAIIKERS